MPDSTRSSRYRAYSITTRCMETAFRSQRFEASFSVSPDAVDEASWQQFSRLAFDSCTAASDNALAAARRSIDQMPFAAQRIWRDAP